jgi:putative redox protein
MEVGMVEIEISYLGELRCQAVHGPSGEKLLTDAPVDNQGKGEWFSPTDLVATALGSCLATVMGIMARREGIDLKGLQVTVQKEMTSTPRRRIGRLNVKVLFPCQLSLEQKVRYENLARVCPVHESLHPDLDMPMEFVYPEES